MELDPHEEAAGFRVARVLVGVDQVGAGGGEETGDRGHDPGPVGAGDRQPADIGPKRTVHRRSIGIGCSWLDFTARTPR